MRKKSFHIWRLIFACFILATISFFCLQGNLLIDFCSRIFVNADVKTSASYSQVLGEPQELVILGATARNKQYDGNTEIDVEVSFAGVASGEEAKVVCKGNVSTPDAGTQKYVYLTDFEITGLDKANYSLPQDINISPVFVDILPKEVELVWSSNQSYTYNGNNQISTISAYYKDIQNKIVPVGFSVKGYSLQDSSSVFVNEFKNAGNYTFDAIPSLSDSNYKLKDNDGDLKLNLKINRAKPVIQISNDRTFVYNGQLQDASKCATINNSEQTLTFRNNTFTTVEEGIAINKNGGVLVVAAQSANYLETSSLYPIDVVKADAVIDISNVKTSFVYSGIEQVVEGAILNNQEQTLKYKYNTFTTVAEGNEINKNGGVLIFANPTKNYNYAEVYVQIKVDKKELDINKMSLKWSATSFTFDGKMKEVKVSNFNDSILDVSYKNERNTEAGSYLATAVFTLRDTENYTLISTTLNKEWTIAKREITKPTVQNYISVYNDSVQALPLQNGTYYSAVNHMQKDAGIYTVAFALNDKNNTVWKDDNSINDLTFTWTISKAKVETPTYKNTVVFDNKNHTLNIEESPLYTILQTSQSAVGEYQTFLVLNDDKNYEWKENSDSAYLALNWKIIENENYDTNTPTIAIAFMLSAVILLALYATLHFTSVRRRKTKKAAAVKHVENSNLKEKTDTTHIVKEDNNQPVAEKSVEEKVAVKAQDKKEEQTKKEVEPKQKLQENKEDKPKDLQVKKEISVKEKASLTENKSNEQNVKTQKEKDENLEKIRKKRMLSRKKADKKKRKKVVVDEAPKKRGRPKKVEGQVTKKKKTTVKKSTKTAASKK